MQYTSPLLSCCLPALNRKLFSADLGEILPIMGKKCVSLMAPFLRDTRLPHALISFFFLSLLLSLSFFFLPLVLLHPPPSFFKSLGSLWCHSMRHYSSGAILYNYIVVYLASVAQSMSPYPAVYYKHQARKVQRTGEQKEEHGGCCF